MQPSLNLNELLDAARASQSRAYAPYSKFSVGAAILADDGNVYVGCNVENASYGVTVCAERNAIGAMVAGGGQKILAIVVVTDSGGTPCGMCRQALAEFALPDAPVYSSDSAGNVQQYTVTQLLPHAFKLKTP